MRLIAAGFFSAPCFWQTLSRMRRLCGLDIDGQIASAWKRKHGIANEGVWEHADADAAMRYAITRCAAKIGGLDPLEGFAE